MNFNDPKLKKHSAIVVHCAATRPSMDIGVKEIESWHIARGFNSCGYHLVIRRDGTYEVGRDWDRQGAHAGGFNRNPKDGKLTFGICMVGGVREDNVNVVEDNFTVAQWKALNIALKSIMEYSGISELYGHRELPNHHNRGCPSFDISTYRIWIKDAMKSLYLPDDWATRDWHDGVDPDWNETTIYKEINVDSGGAE